MWVGWQHVWVIISWFYGSRRLGYNHQHSRWAHDNHSVLTTLISLKISKTFCLAIWQISLFSIILLYIVFRTNFPFTSRKQLNLVEITFSENVKLKRIIIKTEQHSFAKICYVTQVNIILKKSLFEIFTLNLKGIYIYYRKILTHG